MHSKLMWECFEKLNMLGAHNKVWGLGVRGDMVLKTIKAVFELARKKTGTPLHAAELFCGIGNGFVTMTLRNEEERLKEVYWTKLAGMEQCGELMQRHKPKRITDFLNLIQKVN